jgi:hypothetical protein
MFVTPPPVRLPIILFEFEKLAILAMALFLPHPVRLIFMAVPFMIVIVFLVMVAASPLILMILMILRAQRRGNYCYGGYQGGTQKDRIP